MSGTPAVDWEQLQAELQLARGAFDKWALDTVSAADQLRESHVRNITDLRGNRCADGFVPCLLTFCQRLLASR